MNRKVVVIALVLVQVLVFGSLIWWQITRWRDIGWTGMSYTLDAGIRPDGSPRPTRGDRPGRQVSSVVPGGPADRAGLRTGDIVESVNGIDTVDIEQLAQVDAEVRSGDAIPYQIQRDGRVKSVQVTLESPYRSGYMIASTSSNVVVAAVFLAISLLVYWSRPDSRPALIFFLMCAVGAAEYFLAAVIELYSLDLRGILPMGTSIGLNPSLMLVFLAMLLLSAVLINLLLHLSLIFPKRRPILDRWPRVIGWLHTLPFLPALFAAAMVGSLVATRTATGIVTIEVVIAAAAIPLAIALVRHARTHGWRTALDSHRIRSIALLVLIAGELGVALHLLPRGSGFIVGLVVSVSFVGLLVLFMTVYSILTCIALYRSYRESGVEVKRQVRWPLWGTVTALGGSVLIMLVGLVIGLTLSATGGVSLTVTTAMSSVGKLLSLLIPISFAFAILKYRLMDIDVIIRKTVVYSGVTGFIVLVYLLLAGISGLALVRSAGFESQAATVVATLAVVALFVPVRNRIQGFVDRRFFRRERSYQESRRRIGDRVLHATSLDTLLPELAEDLQQTVQCRSVAVLVRPSGSDRFGVEATVGLSDRALTGLAVDRRSSLFSHHRTVIDLTKLELTGEEQRAFHRADASMAVVARRGDDAVGVITIGKKLSRQPFDAEDEGFLSAVADQLALAIGRLHQRRAETEFEQARDIQRSLLPSVLPQIAGVEVAARWQPARETSGDYYDVLRLDGDRLGLCIGDVVGKGMPAALLMSSLQAAVKAVAFTGASPQRVCTQVRSVVRGNLTGGKFVTFFYGVIDGETRRLSYTNAGHNPPLLIRADGTLVRLDIGGPAIARLLGDAAYQEAEIPLQPGDRLVLYTDGVTEAVDSGGELYEERQLEQVIRANLAGSADDLERAVSRHVVDYADGNLQDDLTLVVVAIG